MTEEGDEIHLFKHELDELDSSLNADATSASQLLSQGNPEIKAKVLNIKEKIHMLKRENAELKKWGSFLKLKNLNSKILFKNKV